MSSCCCLSRFSYFSFCTAISLSFWANWTYTSFSSSLWAFLFWSYLVSILSFSYWILFILSAIVLLNSSFSYLSLSSYLLTWLCICSLYSSILLSWKLNFWSLSAFSLSKSIFPWVSSSMAESYFVFSSSIFPVWESFSFCVSYLSSSIARSLFWIWLTNPSFEFSRLKILRSLLEISAVKDSIFSVSSLLSFANFSLIVSLYLLELFCKFSYDPFNSWRYFSFVSSCCCIIWFSFSSEPNIFYMSASTAFFSSSRAL